MITGREFGLNWCCTTNLGWVAKLYMAEELQMDVRGGKAGSLSN